MVRPPKMFRQGASSMTANTCSQLCHAFGPQHTACIQPSDAQLQHDLAWHEHMHMHTQVV